MGRTPNRKRITWTQTEFYSSLQQPFYFFEHFKFYSFTTLKNKNFYRPWQTVIATMDYQLVINLFTNTRKCIRHLPVPHGDNKDLSLVTRVIVYELFTYFKSSCVNATPRQIGLMNECYQDLILEIHHRFWTHQEGNIFARPI